MKVLVVDYASNAAPSSRQQQSLMLLHALLDDLHQVSSIDLVTLAAPRSLRRQFDATVRSADAVWPLAPEARGMLERLSRRVLHHGRILLGSRPHALRVAASRLRTSRVLARASIDVVATYAPGQPLPDVGGAWVVKPDDGASVDETRIFATSTAALAWIAQRGTPGYVLQPFIPGKLGNLSVLCCDGAAQLLGCNKHRIVARDNQFYFLGTTVNSWPDADGAFAHLAQRVAATLPGLWGHVGIDFVQAERGIVVLAVTACMTPAYAGLHASLGCNPAAMVLDLLAPSAHALRPRAQPLAVSVDMAAFGSA